MKQPVYHKDCGKVAFLYEGGIPESGRMVSADKAAKPDGSPIEAHTMMKCYSCGKAVTGKLGYFFTKPLSD